MSEARGLGRDTLLYGLANLLVGLLGFSQLYLFSRLLTPAEFGIYFLILSVATIVNSLAFAWINQTVKRYYPGLAGASRAEFLGRILASFLLTTGLLLLLSAAASAVLPRLGYAASLPWPSLLLAVGTGAVSYVQWLYTIQRRAWDYTLNQLLYNGGRLLLGWLLLAQVAPTGLMLVWAVSAASLLAALTGALHLREPLRLDRASFTRSGLEPLARYGLPLALVNGGGWLLNMAGRVMLAPLAGTAAVGIYSAGQQLAQQVVSLAVLPITTGADPLAIRLHARDGAAAMARFLSLLLGFTVILGGGVCLLLTLLARPLAQAVLDAQYLDAAPLFGYFAPAMLLWLLSPLVIKSQEIGEQLGELPWLMVGAGVCNIGLNFLLIPRWGALGAAVAMLAANALLSALSYWRGQRHLAWPLPGRLLALAGLGLLTLAGLVTVLPQPHGLAQLAAAFAGYMLVYLGLIAAAIWFAPALFRNERSFLRQLAGQRSPVGEAA